MSADDASETLIDIARNGLYVCSVMSEEVEKMKAREASDTSNSLLPPTLNGEMWPR